MMQPKTPKNSELSPARRNWAGILHEDAARNAATAFARAGFSDPTIVLRWEDIAGAEIARIARPMKLRDGPSGGVLTLKAEPGAALFLQHETRTLTARINAYLGRPAIVQLRFVQGPVAARNAPGRRPLPPDHLPPDDPAQRYQGPEGLRKVLLNLARQRRRPPG